jgi:hypothetical protein
MTPVYHHALPAGTRISSYEIRDTLGIGAFGITYRAYDHSLDRVVAVKEYLPSGLAVRVPDGTTVSPKSEAETKDYRYGLRRFLDEARTLARFHEPHVVRIITYLEAHGTAYFVMDYEDGESLDKRLKTAGTLPEEEIRAVIVPILRGLKSVHAQNFLHRDIKPGNIYLRRDGSPVLLDFGAARQAMGERGRNATGMVTPGYAPFEQYLADDKQGPWSDLYALGATMYHCVAGVAPVPSTERVAAVHAGEPDPMAGIGGALKERYSAAFLEAMRWMLQPMPMDRPQTADEALAALGDATNGTRGAPAGAGGTAEGIDLDIDTLTVDEAATQRLTPVKDAPETGGALQRALATLRAWSVDRNRRWILAGLTAATVGGIAIATILLFRSPAAPPSDTDAASTARARADAPLSLLKQAENEIVASNWGNVARLADEALKKNPKHAEALVLKGHVAYYRDKQTGAALQSYGEGLRLKPGLKADPRLAANLVRALDGIGQPAATLLEQHPSPAATKLLAERTGKPGFAPRHLAVDILVRWNERKKIDVRKLVLLDLEEAPECPQRREAVVKIRELKLRQALPALKKMTDVSFLERVFTNHPNACLFDEANKAIAVLEGSAG